MSPLMLPKWEVAWLLLQLRLRRLVNLVGAFGSRSKKRRGTRPKVRNSVMLTAAVVLMMALSYGNLAFQAVTKLHRQVNDPEVSISRVFGSGLLHVLSVELTILTLAGVLMAVGSRELAQADWDLEWLVTLPAEIDTLLWSRVAERTVANAFGMIALWPVCTVLAWEAGFRYSAVALGLLAALPLLILMAMARTLIDTGLRLHLAPSKLRNLQAAISVLSILVFYLSISPAMPAGGQFVLPIASVLPDWIQWTPPGLVLRALGAASLAEAATLSAFLLAEVAAFLMVGMCLLRALLAKGVAAAGTRESGRVRAKRTLSPPGIGGWTLASPVQRRELMLLSRDRNFLVQTMLLPVLIFGMQWVLNGQIGSFKEVWANPHAVAAGAFGIAAYALLLSAFQTLNSEGGALWLLYTFPKPIVSVLLDKAKLWSVIALAYPIIGFCGLLAFGPPPDAATFGLIAMVVLGVPIYSAIAVALGVFGCDPSAADARHRVRPTYLYLYMLLSGLYAYALFAPTWWQSLVFVILTVLLAQALWQKARDQLPFLLDPVAGPPARVSTADGLIAAMLFFVLQILTVSIVKGLGRPIKGPEIVFGFLVAGALTYSSVRFTQWRAKVREVPSILGSQWRKALGAGLSYGIAAAALGIGYLQVVHALGLLDAEANAASDAGHVVLGIWLLPLGVLAAPLFEEFIFRGLIFGGLRRSMPLLPAATASAAMFAIMHPPMAMLPVFALGLCAALAYERSRILLAPMLVHAIYNAAVIGGQAWLTQTSLT